MTRRTQVSSIDIPDDGEDFMDSPEGIPDGALAIGSAEDNTTEKELWERKVSSKSTFEPTDGSNVLRFFIELARIMPKDAKDTKVKRYVVYELVVRLDTSVIDPMPAVIDRRYTDFRNLYTELKKEHPLEMANVSFPNKVIVGNFSENLIGERGIAFEELLTHIASNSVLRNSAPFLYFLQDMELTKACQLLDERRYESAIPLLENCFMLLSKVYMDRSRPVILMLCRLVAACTIAPIPHPTADRWAYLALSRYDTLCDIDLLPLYIPLLLTCEHLWWKRGRDKKPIVDRLAEMSKKGINTKSDVTLMQAIHNLDPRTETI